MNTISKQQVNTPYTRDDDSDYRLGAGTNASDEPEVPVIDTVAVNGLLTQVSGANVGVQFTDKHIDPSSGQGGVY